MPYDSDILHMLCLCVINLAGMDISASTKTVTDTLVKGCEKFLRTIKINVQNKNSKILYHKFYF